MSSPSEPVHSEDVPEAFLVRMPSAAAPRCWFSDPHGHRNASFTAAHHFATRAAAQEALDYRIGVVDNLLRDTPEASAWQPPERNEERRYYEGLRKRLDRAEIVRAGQP